MEQQHSKQWKMTTKLEVITIIALHIQTYQGTTREGKKRTIFTEIEATTSIPCFTTPETKSCSGIGCSRTELTKVLWFKGKDTEILYAYWFVKQKGKKTPKHWSDHKIFGWRKTKRVVSRIQNRKRIKPIDNSHTKSRFGRI